MPGGYTAVTDFLREIRPPRHPPSRSASRPRPASRRRSTSPSSRWCSPTSRRSPRIVWLFSLVLGYSRLIWARFVLHQDLADRAALSRGRLRGAGRRAARDALRPHEDRGHRRGRPGGIVYNRALIDLARHYGFHPKACRPYRAKTKGKVERPFRYIREDFFLARSFRNLEDLNAQLRHWLATVANPRVHATTRRVVTEAFAEEQPILRPLPLAPFRSVLRLERRISREGMVSVGGNFYSVPDATRRRVVEVHTLADEIRIFEDGELIAAHPVLEGRHQRRVAPGHRKGLPAPRRREAEVAAGRPRRRRGRPALARRSTTPSPVTWPGRRRA